MVDTRSTRVCVYGKIKYHTATRDVSLNHCVAIRFACDAYQDIDFRSFVSKRLVNTVFCGCSCFNGIDFLIMFANPQKRVDVSWKIHISAHDTGGWGRGGGGIEQRGKLKWILHICIYIYVKGSRCDLLYEEYKSWGSTNTRNATKMATM